MSALHRSLTLHDRHVTATLLTLSFLALVVCLFLRLPVGNMSEEETDLLTLDEIDQ